MSRRESDWPLLVALGLCLLCLVSPTARIDPAPRRRIVSDWPADPDGAEPWQGGDDSAEDDIDIGFDADPGLLWPTQGIMFVPCPRNRDGHFAILRVRDEAVWCNGCDEGFYPTVGIDQLDQAA